MKTPDHFAPFGSDGLAHFPKDTFTPGQQITRNGMIKPGDTVQEIGTKDGKKWLVSWIREFPEETVICIEKNGRLKPKSKEFSASQLEIIID